MIPSCPEFIEKSYEELIFESLKKLPDDCFVLHSLSIIDPDGNRKKKETEIDFVVIMPNVGCIVIEAKSGQVKLTSEITYYQGEKIEPYTWVYESGKPMKGNGPFCQSRDNMYSLMDYLGHTDYSNVSKKQKFFNCVWFHQLKKKEIQNLPVRPECPKALILTKEDLKTPLESLFKIVEFGNSLMNCEDKTPWDYNRASRIVSNVLAPTMNLVPGKNWEYEYKNAELNKLLIEQERLLEFLSEQKTAVISGAAGTGKTMIALKKAEIESEKGNKVLFLCYNSALSIFLSQNYKKEHVDYYNISQWACQKCKTQAPDYGALNSIIEKEVTSGTFEYKVIIVDEAQDFGQETLDNTEVSVLDQLFEASILLDGLFYLFYDKNQIINSKKLPNAIINSDCKMTLYRNCRNTKRIADASMKVIDQSPITGPNVINGDIPSIRFVDKENVFAELTHCIKCLKENYQNIVILSAKSKNATSIYERINGQTTLIDGKKYPFYTCRQYKGLEADAVVLIDVTSETFTEKRNQLLYYVATSRAKFELVILADMSIEDCEKSCKTLLNNSFIEGFDYREQLAMALSLCKKD